MFTYYQWILASSLVLFSSIQVTLSLPLEAKRQGTGATGLGNVADIFYSVTVKLGDTTTFVNIDTGSSDFWVVSDACTTSVCLNSHATSYALSAFKPTGANVRLQYGDSLTGTHAYGPIGTETVTVAGLTLSGQTFAAINDTDNSALQAGGAGIFGLGFPSLSFVQGAVINQLFNVPLTTDEFVSTTGQNGPLIPRLALAGMLEQPMFTISLDRDTVDIGSNPALLNIGSLPAGVDNSSLTWVPVRLYQPKDGGLNPPTFAANEVYPLRWEIPLDGVYLNGQRLADSTEPASGGVDTSSVSALVDTGNSLLRGPSDVVSNIFSGVSPSYAANSNANPTFPCDTPSNLSFQIGGKMFPIDPRDFIRPDLQNGKDAVTCVANSLAVTDAPSSGTLFRWSLGDPFFKSNLVVFYYGNLSHPSVDPPRMGFMSMVPANADDLLAQAVSDAESNGGNFESTSDAAPTDASSTMLATSPGSSPGGTSTATSNSGSATSKSQTEGNGSGVIQVSRVAIFLGFSVALFL